MDATEARTWMRFNQFMQSEGVISITFTCSAVNLYGCAICSLLKIGEFFIAYLINESSETGVG